MSDKPRFSLSSKIIYAILVILILLMFWPSSRAFLQQGLMKIGLFKPKIEQPDKRVDNQPNEGQSITEGASFKNANGDIIHTDQLKNKVVFINFWATWCGPCVAEMPSIQKLYDQFKNDENVEFLIVEVEGDPTVANDFLKKHKLDLPLYYPAGEIPENWLSGAIPSTVVLDKVGNRIFRHQGMADYADADFVSFIKKLAAE